MLDWSWADFFAGFTAATVFAMVVFWLFIFPALNFGEDLTTAERRLINYKRRIDRRARSRKARTELKELRP